MPDDISVPKMKEWPNGSKEWRLNGKPHRTDGPAVEYSNGRKEWWLNNKKVTWRKVYDSKKGKL